MVLTISLELFRVVLCEFLQLFLLFCVTIVLEIRTVLLDAVQTRPKGQSLPRWFSG